MPGPIQMVGNDMDYMLNKYELKKFMHVINDYCVNGMKLSCDDFNLLKSRYEFDNYFYKFDQKEKRQQHWHSFLKQNTRVNNCLYCDNKKFLGLRGSRKCETCVQSRSLVMFSQDEYSIGVKIK